MGGLLAGYGIVDLAGLFFLMTPRGADPTFSDTMHQILTDVIVFFVILSITFGASAFGKGFHFYTIRTLLMHLVLGTVLTFATAQADIGGSTPWVWLVERIMVFVSMVWMGVLVTTLLHAKKGQTQATTAMPT